MPTLNQSADDKKKADPELKDVEPGSDADETPPLEVGKTPPDPNIDASDADTGDWTASAGRGDAETSVL